MFKSCKMRGMADLEITDSEPARRYLAQGLCLARAASHRPAAVRQALEWLLEIVASGSLLPPPGFVADVGTIAIGADREARQTDPPALAPLAGTVRAYEDYVLGRLYADASIARASDVLRRLTGRDQARGIAFVIEQFRTRAAFSGVQISPSVVKALLELTPDEVLKLGWEGLAPPGPDAALRHTLDALIRAARVAPAALSAQDLFELERGSALADLGQRVALRAVLSAVEEFLDAQPAYPPRARPTHREIPTHVLDEDHFPVGGFAAVSNRGGIESLLQSQLAFMEPASNERPDLFDVKYLRDELLYYSRDENEFLRRRRSFVIDFAADLSNARFKDPTLPCQRILLALASVVTIVRLLTRWLSDDALVFHLRLLTDGAAEVLKPERELLRHTLWDEIDRGVVQISAGATGVFQLSGQRLVVSWARPNGDAGGLNWTLSSERPAVHGAFTRHPEPPNGEPIDDWHQAIGVTIGEWMS